MFTVKVDDNWDYMDETARRTAGRFESEEEAKAACRAIVERFLREQFKPGMTVWQLVAAYRLTGEDPFINSSDQETVEFFSWNYAAIRAGKMCDNT